jgi:hypothetical protein
MNNTDAKEARFESLSAPRKERAIQAKRTYCKACEEHGVKACSWENFSGYQDYVDGRISHSELAGRADEELKDLTRAFGKYTVVEREESAVPRNESEKIERARSANKVYKRVCSESGLAQCFFSNFATWSDYVHGKIDESEFSEKAKLEVEEMLLTSQN